MTLVELLVVAVLLAVLTGLLYGTLGGIIRAREHLLVKRQAYRSAASFFARVRGEFASSQTEPLYQGGTGLSESGSSSGLSTALSGQTAAVRYVAGTSGKSDTESDSIRFTTTAGAQELYDAESNRGLIEVSYRVEASQGGGNIGILVREEMPAGVKNDVVLRRRRRTFPVCDRVIAFKLRYFRDGKWLTEWKDSTTRLPKAVDIELVLADKNGDPVFARTALPFGPPKLETTASSIQLADGAGGSELTPVPSPTPQ